MSGRPSRKLIRLFANKLKDDSLLEFESWRKELPDLIKDKDLSYIRIMSSAHIFGNDEFVQVLIDDGIINGRDMKKFVSGCEGSDTKDESRDATQNGHVKIKVELDKFEFGRCLQEFFLEFRQKLEDCGVHDQSMWLYLINDRVLPKEMISYFRSIISSGVFRDEILEKWKTMYRGKKTETSMSSF